jgi:hypothetical protein
LYESANQALARVYGPEMQDQGAFYSPVSVKNVNRALAGFDFSVRPGGIRSPVFLVGFPRSGTTLLDQILSSHSQISVLEEKENLQDAYSRFPATEQGLSRLQAAGEQELKQLRRKYWNRLSQEGDELLSKPVIIDKLPLNSIALLHIFRLFPEAKIIVALRDPRDCVFSCYQQRFGMNQAMFQLLQLDTAVSYYDQVMSIVKNMRDKHALPMHFVRYERVIADFTGEMKSLIGFLGLQWEDALFDYRETAKSRYISTPSAAQVIQPLYTSSIGKWKHFREWIGAEFDPLEKWVNEWGY